MCCEGMPKVGQKYAKSEGRNMMTNEEIDELLRICAENAEQMERANAAYFESEEWRELSALLERAKELEKDLPAFDVPHGFLLDETSFSGFESAW